MCLTERGGHNVGFVKANPITHLTDAARGLVLGSVDAGSIGWVLVWSAGLLVLFAPLTIRMYLAER
jgi:ABC-type polysaccharide/polyol phosphate export permease